MVKMDELIKESIKRYGYDENARISLEQFNSIVKEEKLDEYCTIAFNTNDLSVEDMVALVRDGLQYTVVTTGERGTMMKKTFPEMELALSYMIYKLRIAKNVAIKNESAYINKFKK